MDSKIFQNLPPNERVEAIKANADNTETLTYQKQLSEDDITEFNHHLSQTAITQKRLKEEKSELVKEKNAEIKDVTTRLNEYIGIINRGSMEMTDTVYFFKDFEKGRVLIYDKYGDLISNRKMLPSERQISIHSQLREAV